MSDNPSKADATARLKPTCPRCGSVMIMIGRLNDSLGNPVQFAAVDADGFAANMGIIKSCYCNDCGEVTLTLE